MNDLDFLKEGLGNKVFRSEPFAQALLLYLEQQGVVDHSEFLKVFDTVVNRDLNQIIKDQRGDDEASKTQF